ncbi:Golgi reassembly-stacking protein 1,Golgi reassembly-stacking protein 2 [Lepeophtheirus salmonis]|uniref:Golgi reassembly-stacking protein 1,Golgi reassembly-stacking protein 2 n=1 Tax=Lepeophtheirus salmonis TaxID=72036 RepID=A0A7R8CUX5_LEPSM|nr:Golgi reassembly-stacking protein 1,Golgi reassembly-stacking protein 2 [Lepeophtheirus salmonis]CAF2904193.1 Golgi reassembly-stacking protein 1,Golgi reassembly-stacking protein 2 [Lepeophtheirus salmonis]
MEEAKVWKFLGEVVRATTYSECRITLQDKRRDLRHFFDFIVGIGKTRLDQDNDTLKDLVKTNVEKEISMTVYSSKTQTVREIFITPSNLWGGMGLLGISIRFCSFEGAYEHVWHILEVHPGSPAEAAGLRSYTDYIVSADSVLHDFMFTTRKQDHCREVTITPNGAWEGEGSVGCGIGYGYLHRIPRDNPRESVPIPRGSTPSTAPMCTNKEEVYIPSRSEIAAAPPPMMPILPPSVMSSPVVGTMPPPTSSPDIPIFGTGVNNGVTTPESVALNNVSSFPIPDPAILAGMPPPPAEIFTPQYSEAHYPSQSIIAPPPALVNEEKSPIIAEDASLT